MCVTEGAGFPYIYALFASREDPHEFIRTVHYSTPGEEWQQVASFGRYRFGIPLTFQPEIDVYIVYPGEPGLPEPYFSTERLGAFVQTSQTAAVAGPPLRVINRQSCQSALAKNYGLMHHK